MNQNKTRKSASFFHQSTVTLMALSTVFFSLVLGRVSLSAGVVEEYSRITDRAARHDAQMSPGGWQHSQGPAAAGLFAPLASSVAGEDLRLSESVSPAAFQQGHSSICALSDGSVVVAWEDNREGASKIFLQKYNPTGSAVGANVKIAERSDGYDLTEPLVVATISGKLYLAFRDKAAGEIHALRLNPDLTVDLAEFVASDTTNGIYAGPFSVSSRVTTGELIVAYESYGPVKGIVARRFLPDGSADGAPFVVNSGMNETNRWAPSVVFAEDGGFAVCWEDYSSGAADIYFRRFDSLSAPLTDDINLIDPSAQSAGQYLPSLVYSPIHGYVVAWTDTRDGWQVFLQRYSKQIGPVGANLRVSPFDTSRVYSDPEFSVGPSGLLSIIYCEYAFRVSAMTQRFDASLAPIGAPVVVNALTGDLLLDPVITIGPSGKYAMAWTGERNGLKDIRYLATDASLNPLQATEQTVNDDAIGAASDQPALAVIDGVTVVTAFHDQRRDAGDIYFQRNTLDGIPVGANTLVNQDSAGAEQSQPCVSANSSQFVVAWLDSRRVAGVPGSRVYVRYGTAKGEFFGTEILASGTNASPKTDPSIALAGNGKALVAWTDFRASSPQIYAQFLGPDGQLQGQPFAISSLSIDEENERPTVSVDGLNRFTVTWLDRGALAGPTIKFKRYDSNGLFLNSEDFLSDQTGVTIESVVAAVDSGGLAHALWRGVAADGTSDLYLTRVNIPGGVFGPTQPIKDHISARPESQTISVDGAGNTLMAWIDHRESVRRLYYQIFDASLSPQGGNQPFSQAIVPAMYSPSAVAVRGRSWISWADARSEGMNVYNNTVVHFPTDVNDDDPVTLPEGFSLGQNYPNPFNPSTKIEYTLDRRSSISLRIYDITGRTVRTLETGEKPAGSYSVLWDGRDDRGAKVASGVYLYRLHAGERALTRKMTLLK